MRVRGYRTFRGLCSRRQPLTPTLSPRGEGEIISTRDLLDAGDQFVDGLVDRHLLAHHPVHRLGPDVLVVEDRELPVLGEVERRGAAGELIVHRLAMAVSLPERALLAGRRHREPADERALDLGTDILFLQQALDELLAL